MFAYARDGKAQGSVGRRLGCLKAGLSAHLCSGLRQLSPLPSPLPAARLSEQRMLPELVNGAESQ